MDEARSPGGIAERTAAPAPRTTGRDELVNLVRAVSGGLLFGVPLLYTMEVWWTGSRTTPAQMAVVLGLLFVPVFVLNKTAGFRARPDVHVLDAAADTVEAVAIGIVATGAVLVLLRQITLETPVGAVVGMILYESIPFCLGVGVARHFLHGGRDGDDDDDREDDDGGPPPTRTRRRVTGDRELDATLADLGATVIGAAFISLSIAPTDEVPMIASTMSPGWVLLVLGASLLVSYAVVFVAGFSGQGRRQQQEGVFQRPMTETVVCYLLALATAMVMLVVFRRGADPWSDALTRAVVLGLPAAVGGAAGRLAI